MAFGNRRKPTELFVPGNTKGYEVEKCYTRSKDADGHRGEVRVTFPLDVMAVVHEIVERVPEYNTPADLFRDAAIHRMEWWVNHEEELDSPRNRKALRQAEIVSERIRATEQHLKEKAMVEDAQRQLREVEEQGSWEEIITTWEAWEEMADTMGEFYGAKMRKVVEPYKREYYWVEEE